jgi:hypothetical protein
VKKIPLFVIVLCICASVAHAAGPSPDKEIDELFAAYAEHQDVFNACYMLRDSGVLTGAMREQILTGAADRKKGMACVLAITSVEAGMKITDSVSVQKLREYLMGKVACVEAEVDLRNARNALEMYYLDNAKYPANLDDILGAYVVSFTSKMDYRLETDSGRYVVSATNARCDKKLTLTSDSAEIVREPASGPLQP